jgi:hypothetical protein
MVLLVGDARAQWAELDRRIAAFDTEFVRSVKDNEDAQRLATIPGFGAIIASALIAAVRAENFDRGRDLSAWLGIVPRQFTTCGKPKLLGIGKRGNSYLRRQLIRGARAALPMWPSATLRSAGGQKGSWGAPITMSPLSPSPRSWPGSPGRLRHGEPFDATRTPAAA